jgi:hypothetical protein
MSIMLSTDEGSAEMSSPDNIRKFEYRPCRIATGFDVDFIAAGETFHGICKDVGNSGIRAIFDSSVPVESSGLLILRHPLGLLKLDAQVVYIENHQVGLEFRFNTPWECSVAIEFIASIANHSEPPLIVRFPCV